MNRKIYELALQAGFSTWVLNPSKETMSDTPELLKKFAELIVLECLLCCERTISDPVPESVDTFEQGGIHCRDEIRKHFGVEE